MAFRCIRCTVTMNLLLKLTGARHGREVRAILRASNDFFASIGRGPALNPESFLTNLFNQADMEE